MTYWPSPLQTGRSVKDGNRFPVLRLTALKNRRIDLSEYKLGAWNATDAARFIVQKGDILEGDILVSRGNGSIDLVGRGGLVIDEPHDHVAYPDTLIRVQVTSSFDRDLLTLLWDSPIIRQKIEAAAHTTAGIYKVSQADLQQIPLPLPPLEEQREIILQAIDHLHGIEKVSGELSKALNALDHLDQSILTKAFRGELVPQDPNDESALALLERIRAQREQRAEDTEKAFKMRRRSKMEKKPSELASQRRSLAEVLAANGQPMHPEQLLTEAGYDDGSIEYFYVELREEIQKGRVREDRPPEGNILLEALKL
jgi:type I restriction enzyme S subunit